MSLLLYFRTNRWTNRLAWKGFPPPPSLPTENHNCLSLPTKVGFFEKVPTEERKSLGATHLWNQPAMKPALAIKKIGDWKKLRFWYKTSHFEILLVHELLQQLTTAGEIMQQEYWLYDELALLAFYRITHCTKLPQVLLCMFIFGAVE